MAKQSAADTTSENEEIGPHKPELNLYQRIHAIMGDVRRLQKDKAVGSGNFSYKAMSEEKVVTALREAMLRHGVVMFPIEQQHSLNDLHRENGKIVSLSTVDVRYKLANVDKMDEFEIIASSGTGVDSQDKGVGKAMTYSFKYALLRTFMVPTGNDPDDVHNDVLEKEQEKRAATQAEPVRYMTATQRDEITALLAHPAITTEEVTKVQLALPKLTEEKAASTIKTLKKWNERPLSE